MDNEQIMFDEFEDRVIYRANVGWDEEEFEDLDDAIEYCMDNVDDSDTDSFEDVYVDEVTLDYGDDETDSRLVWNYRYDVYPVIATERYADSYYDYGTWDDFERVVMVDYNDRNGDYTFDSPNGLVTDKYAEFANSIMNEFYEDNYDSDDADFSMDSVCDYVAGKLESEFGGSWEVSIARGSVQREAEWIIYDASEVDDDDFADVYFNMASVYDIDIADYDGSDSDYFAYVKSSEDALDVIWDITGYDRDKIYIKEI